MHRDPSVTRQEPPLSPRKEEPALPPKATGIFLGLWIVVLLVLAFVVVPEIFAACIPPAEP